jgi:hypothetical protein
MMEAIMRSDTMKIWTRGLITTAALLLAFSLGACAPEEEPTPCEKYCDAAEECSYASHQMFSYSECLRECGESVERHRSVYCDERYIDYLFCLVNLHCADWSQSGQYCAAEIDWLDSCLGGQS